MPIYEYYCPKCEKSEDRLVNYSNSHEQYCKCDENDPSLLERIESMTNNAFHLKGVWYKTRKTY